MRRSVDRILTTHVGSLPRSEALVDYLYAREEGELVDVQELNSQARADVASLVDKQLAAGIDIIDDGEASKTAFVRYITDRLSGFHGVSSTPAYADLEDFPDYQRSRPVGQGRRMPPNPACEAPVEVRNSEAVQRDIANLKEAIGNRSPEDCFMPAASPGVIAMNLDNHYYPTHEEYLYAVAEAIKQEYHAITDAGFLLQLDCPDLAMGRHRHFKDKSIEEFRANSALSIEALNWAIAGIPPGQLRLHVCWGNYPGP